MGKAMDRLFLSVFSGLGPRRVAARWRKSKPKRRSARLWSGRCGRRRRSRSVRRCWRGRGSTIRSKGPLGRAVAACGGLRRRSWSFGKPWRRSPWSSARLLRSGNGVGIGVFMAKHLVLAGFLYV